MDPMAEKYYSISPYCYAGNNPIRNIDLNGDSVTMLNGDLHSAMLIQNDEGKWQYYSMNGDKIYKKTKGLIGGKPYHDRGEKTFNSPQEFLESDYNAKGSKEQISENAVNNYAFEEGYVIPTTPEQDNTIRETFTDISTNENYSLLSNNCATTVQRSLDAADIQTAVISITIPIGRGETFQFTKTYNSFIPGLLFKSMVKNNPKGTYIKR